MTRNRRNSTSPKKDKILQEVLARRVIPKTQEIYMEVFEISKMLGLNLSELEIAKYSKLYMDSVDIVIAKDLEFSRENERGTSQGRDRPPDDPGSGMSEAKEKYVVLEYLPEGNLVSILNKQSEEIEQLKSQLKQYEKHAKDLQNKLNKKEQEINKIKRELQKLKEKNNELISKNQSPTKENKKRDDSEKQNKIIEKPSNESQNQSKKQEKSKGRSRGSKSQGISL